MDDSLLGNEFARLLHASRTNTPRRHYLRASPLSSQSSLLSAGCKSRPSPPMSPVSGHTPLPPLNLGTPLAPIRPYGSAHTLQSVVPPLRLAFGAPPQGHELENGTPISFDISRPACSEPDVFHGGNENHMSRWTEASPCAEPVDVTMHDRLPPIPPPLELPIHTVQPRPYFSGRVSLLQTKYVPHRPVSDMADMSEPHPLNILADISSSIPKSPVKPHSAPVKASTPSPRKSISKSPKSSSPGKCVRRFSPQRPLSAPTRFWAEGESEAGSPCAMEVAGNVNSAPSSSTSKPVSAGHDEVQQMKTESGPSRQGKEEVGANGRRIFSCSLCSSSFSERFNLNKHVRAVHEQRRPFQCVTCHARFQQRDHMQKHEMCVHKKLRQFSCDACGASFGWRGVLKKHRKSVHGLFD